MRQPPAQAESMKDEANLNLCVKDRSVSRKCQSRLNLLSLVNESIALRDAINKRHVHSILAVAVTAVLVQTYQ